MRDNFGLLLLLVLTSACSTQVRNERNVSSQRARDPDVTSGMVNIVATPDSVNPSDAAAPGEDAESLPRAADPKSELQKSTAPQPGDFSKPGEIKPSDLSKPSETTLAENTPPVQRTTVIVSNGRFEKPVIGSYRFRFPSTEQTLQKILYRLQTLPTGKNLQITEENGLKTVCANNPEDGSNDYFSVLFSHLAHASANPDVLYSESPLPCDKPADFKYAAGALNKKGGKYPNFKCRDEGKQKITVVETAENPKKVYTAVNFLDEKEEIKGSIHFKKFALDSDGLFLYEAGAYRLLLDPYKSKDGKIAGLWQDKDGQKNLACGLILNGYF